MKMKNKRFINFHIRKINYIEYYDGDCVIGSSGKGIEKIVIKALEKCDSFFFVKKNIDKEVKIELEIINGDNVKEYLIYCEK